MKVTPGTDLVQVSLSQCNKASLKSRLVFYFIDYIEI